MKAVGIFDAKKDLPSLLDEVEMGETVVITRLGKRVAVLEPVSEPAQPTPRPGERRRRSPEEVQAILAEFREFREAHRGALRGLSVRELIDDGRKY